MAEVRPKMRWGVEEEAIMGILFGEEIKCLGSDGFEGSEEDRRICMSVLYEVNISNFGNASSKIGNSQSKECSLNKQPRSANTENLVLANPHSLNDTLVNISGHFEVNNNNVNGVLESKRHHLQSMTTSNNTNAKRLRMSSSDPLQIKELVTTITKNGNKLLNCCPLQKSNSSTAPSSVTAHPRQQCSQSHNVSFTASRIDSPVLSKDTPCSSMNAANQKDKLGSFNVFGDGIWRALPLQESDKIAGGSYFKPTDTSCNTHGRNEELGAVRQQSRNNSGNTGNFFMVDPAHEHPAARGKENHSYVIKKNDHLISEDGVVFLEPQHIKSFDEVLIPDPGSSQEAGEVKKTELCKKRGRKKQHSVEINDGSSQEAGEVRKTIVCKKRRKEQTA
ncbi:hypothetical protein M5K25_006979 [Dendrobium thyrsiflorum]|uniref:Uncharacterized protein n=1 Tax=Dendrobium thyrsiflorum TaxID=117978 RepID=A0ABD0VD66_DENTH